MSIAVLPLACGMPLVVEPMSGVGSLALCWLLPGGAACDPPAGLGRAAVWSEMLVRGAGNLDSRAQADAFDRLGCARGVEVGSRHMRFLATMLGTRLGDALPLVVDMARRPRMDHRDFEPARDLALQAIESLRDDPQERAVLAAAKRHFAAPFNRSGLGTPEGLGALTHAGCAAEWAATARPRGSIFAAAGAVDPDQLRRTLDALLAGWEGLCEPPVPAGPASRGYEHLADGTNQVQIVLLHDAPPEGHPDSLLEKVVISVLSGGMSGRFFEEVREKRGLCYSVAASYRGDKEFGAVTAYVGTTPQRAQESLDVLAQELRRIGSKGGEITYEEFDRAVVGMKSRLVLSGESTSARASALAADMSRLGRPRSLDELAAAIDDLTLDRVNAYLRRRTLGTVTIETLGPDELRPPAVA